MLEFECSKIFTKYFFDIFITYSKLFYSSNKKNKKTTYAIGGSNIIKKKQIGSELKAFNLKAIATWNLVTFSRTILFDQYQVHFNLESIEIG